MTGRLLPVPVGAGAAGKRGSVMPRRKTLVLVRGPVERISAAVLTLDGQLNSTSHPHPIRHPLPRRPAVPLRENLADLRGALLGFGSPRPRLLFAPSGIRGEIAPRWDSTGHNLILRLLLRPRYCPAPPGVSSARLAVEVTPLQHVNGSCTNPTPQDVWPALGREHIASDLRFCWGHNASDVRGGNPVSHRMRSLRRDALCVAFATNLDYTGHLR